MTRPPSPSKSERVLHETAVSSFALTSHEQIALSALGQSSGVTSPAAGTPEASSASSSRLPLGNQDEPLPTFNREEIPQLLAELLRQHNADHAARAETNPGGATFPPQAVDVPDSDLNQAPQQALVTEAMQIRLSLARRVISTLAQGGPSRNRLAIVTLLGGAQIIAWSVILGMTNRTSCDKPLRLYLILIIIKLGLMFPIAFYTALVPPLPSGRDTAERMAEREANRQIGTRALDHRVKKASDLLWLLSLVLFVLGNIWVISASRCKVSAPVLWRASVAALIINYATMFEALVVCICVILFLPFALYNMRGYLSGQNEVGPLSKKDMAHLPKRIFIGAKPDEQGDSTTNASTEEAVSAETVVAQGVSATIDASESKLDVDKRSSASASNSTEAPRPKRSGGRRFGLLWRHAPKSQRGRRDDSQSRNGSATDFVDLPVPGILLEPSQTACSICLCEYELPPIRGSSTEGWEPELLHLLPCGHCFHVECSESWLTTSGRCPLCQRQVDPPGRKGRSRRGNATASNTVNDAEDGHADVVEVEPRAAAMHDP